MLYTSYMKKAKSVVTRKENQPDGAEELFDVQSSLARRVRNCECSEGAEVSTPWRAGKGEMPDNEETTAGEAGEPDDAVELAKTEVSILKSADRATTREASNVPTVLNSLKCLLLSFVHVSEMLECPVRRPQRVAQTCYEIAVKVIEVQRKQRHVAL